MACLASAAGGAGCDDEPPSGADALAEARQRLMDAPRVVIYRERGRVETYAAGLTAIEEGGRVLTWANRRIEHYWLPRRRCYDSATEFERADFRDQRRGTLPEVDSARVVERSGRTLIIWRVEDVDRGPDQEGTVRLDGESRPVVVNARYLPWGGEPARPAFRTTISYPARIRIPRPSPLCPDAR